MNRTQRRNFLRGGSGWRWSAIKGRVLDRDGHSCQQCAEPCPHPRHHEVDHRVPLAFGGPTDPSNLWTLCRTCHGAKTAAEQVLRPPAPQPQRIPRARPAESHPGVIGGGGIKSSAEAPPEPGSACRFAMRAKSGGLQKWP